MQSQAMALTKKAGRWAIYDLLRCTWLSWSITVGHNPSRPSPLEQAELLCSPPLVLLPPVLEILTAFPSAVAPHAGRLRRWGGAWTSLPLATQRPLDPTH